MGETIERIVELILNNFEEGEKSLRDHPQDEGSNITLVLGIPAAGKSTLIHYIAKNNSQLISKPIISPDTKKITNYIMEDADKKIGHRFNGQPSTYTKLPELTFDPITKTFFCDSTGFEDNRNATYDITSTYFTKKISNRAKFLKFVFVINYNSVNAGNQDDRDFILLAKHATNMIKNIDKFNDGICLIATNVKEEKSDVDVLDSMNTYLYELKKKLEPDGSQTETIKFIGVLRTKNGNNDAKLGFIRQPKAAGPVSDIPEMQARKLLLLKLLHNVKFIENDNPADLDYTISKDSRNYVGDLVSTIHLQIRNNIDAIMSTTQKYYNHIAEQMENKMNSFIYGIVSEKAHPSQVQILNDKLNARKITLEQLTNEMENVTDVIELSKKIDKLVNLDTKNYNISKYASTISAKGHFVTFLQTFYNSSSPIKWMESFKQTMDKFLKSVADRLQSNAIAVKDRLEKKSQQEMIKNANSIAAAFHAIQKSEPTLDDEQQLLSFNNTVMAMDPVCISQTVQKLTAMNSSCDNQFMLNIAKYDNYLEFMKKLIKTNDQSNNTSECAKGQDIIITYLRNATIWYCFLLQLHNCLSEYEVQNNTQKHNILTEKSFQSYVNQTVGSTDLNVFLKLCCSNLYRIMFSPIDNVVPNDFKVNGLKNVIQSTFRNDLNVSCESNEMLVKGQFVKMSDIISNWCNGLIHSIKIFSLHKLFVDASLRKPGEKLQVFIIAPIWEVRGHQQIILDGKTGNVHSKSKAEDAGQNGIPGLPGGAGGNFVGFGESCIHCDNLYITVNGGKGGPGQDGGDGATGSHSNGSIEIQIPAKSEDKIFLGNIVHQYWIRNPFPSFQKKGFQIDRIKWEIIQFHRWLPIRVEVYLVYKDGGSGGNGGNGGIGGSGGSEGKVSIKFINQSHLNISQNTGAMGSHGLGGQGGKPGKDGELLVAKISKKDDFFDYNDLITSEEMRFYIESSDSVEIPGTVDNKIWYEIFDERRYSYILNQINITAVSGPGSKAIAGVDGIPGNNTRSVVQPEETFLADTSHVINSYKNYCAEQLSANTSIRELEMKNFLDQLDFMKDQSYDRRRRQTENNDGESYYRNERLTAARNSAGKIKSPLNYVINWFSSGIKQLKFWSFSTITNGNTAQLATTKLQNFANDYINDDTGISLNDNFNINELLLLADFIFKYFTKAKSYNYPIENSVHLLEIRACVLDIVEKFETLLNNRFFGPNLRLEFDPLTLMTNLEKEIIGDNLIEIPNILFRSIVINDDYNGTWKLDENSFSTQIRNKIEEMLEQRDDFLQEQFVNRHNFIDCDLKMDKMNKISNFFNSPCNVNLIE